jgi:hypothetical protein
MALLLHQTPIRLLQEVTVGLDLLLSADSSGSLAVWECATCHCKMTRSIPELKDAVGLLVSQLQGTGVRFNSTNRQQICWGSDLGVSGIRAAMRLRSHPVP